VNTGRLWTWGIEPRTFQLPIQCTYTPSLQALSLDSASRCVQHQCIQTWYEPVAVAVQCQIVAVLVVVGLLGPDLAVAGPHHHMTLIQEHLADPVLQAHSRTATNTPNTTALVPGRASNVEDKTRSQ